MGNENFQSYIREDEKDITGDVYLHASDHKLATKWQKVRKNFPILTLLHNSTVWHFHEASSKLC